jgi:hypothetical protein
LCTNFISNLLPLLVSNYIAIRFSNNLTVKLNTYSCTYSSPVYFTNSNAKHIPGTFQLTYYVTFNFTYSGTFM